MEWWLNHVGQMAQSVQDYSILPKNEGKILLTLLKNAPNIVTKEELYNILWGTDEFIDDNALQVNLVRLRKTLARFGLEQRIETVRGQGYRMKG